MSQHRHRRPCARVARRPRSPSSSRRSHRPRASLAHGGRGRDALTFRHTYGVGIHPDRLECFDDGVRVRTITATTSGMRRGLSSAHSIVLNLAIGGSGALDTGDRPGTAPPPYAADFDYVRVRQP